MRKLLNLVAIATCLAMVLGCSKEEKIEAVKPADSGKPPSLEIKDGDTQKAGAASVSTE